MQSNLSDKTPLGLNQHWTYWLFWADASTRTLAFSVIASSSQHITACLKSIWIQLLMLACVFLSYICCVCMLVAQSCLTVYGPMDCSPPGSAVYGILQARVLKWVATPFSRGSSQPRDQTWVSSIAGRFIIIWATREAIYIAGVSQSI